jgi:hypothetical protein
VRFQNSATGLDLGFYAARSYSLKRPPKDGPALDPLLREVCDWVVGPGRAELAAAMGSSSVAVRLVFGQNQAQMSFAEDQHLVGDLGPGGEHEPFRISVRPGTSGRDLHRLDTGTGQDRVDRLGELPGPVADQEPEVRGPITEVHEQIADLLGGPRPVRVRGDPDDVHVAGADLHHEEAIHAL